MVPRQLVDLKVPVDQVASIHDVRETDVLGHLSDRVRAARRLCLCLSISAARGEPNPDSVDVIKVARVVPASRLATVLDLHAEGNRKTAVTGRRIPKRSPREAGQIRRRCRWCGSIHPVTAHTIHHGAVSHVALANHVVEGRGMEAPVPLVPLVSPVALHAAVVEMAPGDQVRSAYLASEGGFLDVGTGRRIFRAEGALRVSRTEGRHALAVFGTRHAG